MSEKHGQVWKEAPKASGAWVPHLCRWCLPLDLSQAGHPHAHTEVEIFQTVLFHSFTNSGETRTHQKQEL